MTTKTHRSPVSEFRLLTMPLVVFLLVFLGFPAIDRKSVV